MEHSVAELLSTFGDFTLYLVSAFALTWLFVVVYVRVTPYRELPLIRAGNSAAALSLGGAILGFVMVLAAVIIHSVSLVDLLLWGVVAALTQMVAYAAVRLMISDIAKGVEEDRLAHGIFLGACSLATGILAAACVTP